MIIPLRSPPPGGKSKIAQQLRELREAVKQNQTSFGDNEEVLITRMGTTRAPKAQRAGGRSGGAAVWL